MVHNDTADISKILSDKIEEWLIIEFFSKAILSQPDHPLAEWHIAAVKRGVLKSADPVQDFLSGAYNKELRALTFDKSFRVNVMAHPQDPQQVGVKLFYIGKTIISWDTVGILREIIPGDWAYRAVDSAITGPSRIVAPDPAAPLIQMPKGHQKKTH